MSGCGGNITGFTDTFLKGAGAKLDFFDLHHYGQCENDPSEEDLLSQGVNIYKDQIDKVKARIKELVPARADQIEIQIGEYNMVACDRKVERTLTPIATVWGAATLGTILATDANAIQFSDRNQGLGLTSQGDMGGLANNDPHPIYHAIGMFTGAVRVDTLGTYTFTTTSDDGVRLWIDDSIVVDMWDAHTIRDDAGQAALTPGWHPVKLEFHDQAEIAFLELSWQGPDFEREDIPTDRLRPATQ